MVFFEGTARLVFYRNPSSTSDIAGLTHSGEGAFLVPKLRLWPRVFWEPCSALDAAPSFERTSMHR